MKTKKRASVRSRSNESSELIALALEARLKSHSPYSRAKVGAALRTESGELFAGCNIENSSFGATICAERVAIHTAVCAGYSKIKEIAVATDASPPWPPCGLCRQVMTEFADLDLKIITTNPKGETRTFTLGQLVPEAFTPKHLTRKN